MKPTITKILITLVLGLFLMSANAQNYWEVMIPDFCAPKEIYKNDTLLNVFVRNGNTGEPWFYKYSINGNYLFSKKLFDHNISYILKNINDTAYVMTGCYSIDTIIYKIIIYFNQNLDTIWTHKDSTFYPINSEYLSFAVLESEIVAYYFTHNIDIPNNNQSYIRHFDFSGHVTYDTINPLPGHTYTYNDSTLLIVKGNPLGMTRYLKTDKYLNIIDSTTINKAWDDYNYTTRVSDNGEILAYSQGLYLLDANLSLMWTKPIWEIYSGTGDIYPHDIQFTTNGGYALGGAYHYDYHDMGFLFNLDENLSVINNNIYSYWYIFEWVHRIVSLNDGSFILLASAENLTGRTWLFHTDLDGSVLINEMPEPEQIQVYPNPAQNELTITFNEYTIGHISLKTITGKIVWQANVNNEAKMVIPVESFTSGMYILTVLSQNKVFTSKICKQ